MCREDAERDNAVLYKTVSILERSQLGPQRTSELFFLNELLIDMTLPHVFSAQPVIYHPDMNIGFSVWRGKGVSPDSQSELISSHSYSMSIPNFFLVSKGLHYRLTVLLHLMWKKNKFTFEIMEPKTRKGRTVFSPLETKNCVYGLKCFTMTTHY